MQITIYNLLSVAYFQKFSGGEGLKKIIQQIDIKKRILIFLVLEYGSLLNVYGGEQYS